MSVTYLSFAAAVTLLIASPGPIVALVVADARRAWPLWTIAGGGMAALLLLVAALAAIYLTLDIDPASLSWGQVVGGGYLLWLGVKTLRTAAERETTHAGDAHGFWRALGVGLSNPKDILFFLAFLPGFIAPADPFAPQAVALILIWGALDISIMLIYSGLTRHVQSFKSARTLLDWAPGYFLLAIGLLSIAVGLGRIFQ